MPKLSKPTFQKLLDNYNVNPSSVHDCPRIYQKDEIGNPNVNTCAVRFTEALVIALGLVDTRTKIGSLTHGGGDGRAFLLGHYNYRDLLCPHGIARGARDVAYFLKEQWGAPTKTFLKPGKEPEEIKGMQGAISFIKIPGYGGQGHMDLWNKTACAGHGYFGADKVWFWRLE